jgi:hypothetical protein
MTDRRVTGDVAQPLAATADRRVRTDAMRQEERIPRW